MIRTAPAESTDMKNKVPARIPTTYCVMLYISSSDGMAIFHEFDGPRKEAIAFFKSRGPGLGRHGWRKKFIHKRVLYKMVPVNLKGKH